MAVTDDIRKSVGYASVGFGAIAILAPRLFLGMYGVPNDQNVRLMTRMWGTRTGWRPRHQGGTSVTASGCGGGVQ